MKITTYKTYPKDPILIDETKKMKYSKIVKNLWFYISNSIWSKQESSTFFVVKIRLLKEAIL